MRGRGRGREKRASSLHFLLLFFAVLVFCYAESREDGTGNFEESRGRAKKDGSTYIRWAGICKSLEWKLGQVQKQVGTSHNTDVGGMCHVTMWIGWRVTYHVCRYVLSVPWLPDFVATIFNKMLQR